VQFPEGRSWTPLAGAPWSISGPRLQRGHLRRQPLRREVPPPYDGPEVRHSSLHRKAHSRTVALWKCWAQLGCQVDSRAAGRAGIGHGRPPATRTEHGNASYRSTTRDRGISSAIAGGAGHLRAKSVDLIFRRIPLSTGTWPTGWTTPAARGIPHLHKMARRLPARLTDRGCSGEHPRRTPAEIVVAS